MKSQSQEDQERTRNKCLEETWKWSRSEKCQGIVNRQGSELELSQMVMYQAHTNIEVQVHA